MTTDIAEADWKGFTTTKSVALDRFCREAVARVAEIDGDARLSDHESFVGVLQHTRDADKELARLFDGHSRSQARFQLMHVIRRGLLTPEELSRLSVPLRGQIG